MDGWNISAFDRKGEERRPTVEVKLFHFSGSINCGTSEKDTKRYGRSV
jgi:hypothetical protein